MPTYQYACTECVHEFEQVQSFSDSTLTQCPACEGRLRKVYNAVGVVFKGSGFYRNDSRSGTNGDTAASGSTDSSSSDSSSSKDSGASKESSSAGAKESSSAGSSSATPSSSSPAPGSSGSSAPTKKSATGS